MKNIYVVLIALGLLFVTSCSDVLIDDLASEQVILRAPANNLVTNTQLQTFWWDELDETVDSYTLEIVSPSFDSIVELVLRVGVTEENPYETTLLPGNYQWTVIATNSRNESKPMVYDLQIMSDSTMDLSNQNIALVQPASDSYFNTGEVNFLWQPIVGVLEYRIQVGKPDFSNSTFFVLDESTTEDYFSTTLEEGIYRWRVRGENDNSVTPYSIQSFTIDFTAPTAPELLSPNNGDTLSLPITLTWDVDETSDFDSLFVYTDSLISPPIITEALSATSYSFSNNSSSVYFWRLRSVDAAGNVGPYSSLRKFYVD